MDGLGAAYRDANADDDPHGRVVRRGAARWSATSRWRWCSPSAALRVAGGALELGVLTAFLLYLRRFYDPLDELAQFFNAYQSAAAALEKIAGVLDTPPDVPEPAAPVALPSPVRGRAAVRGGAVRLPVRPAAHRAARAVADRARRADGGPGRRHRGGQVDAGQAGRPVLRPHRRARSPLDGVDLRDVADAELRAAW